MYLIPEKNRGNPKIPIIGMLKRDVINILTKLIGSKTVNESIMNLFGFTNLKLFVVFILYNE